MENRLLHSVKEGFGPLEVFLLENMAPWFAAEYATAISRAEENAESSHARPSSNGNKIRRACAYHYD